jgi:RNA polymerase sigma-70 factor (ECF subfamily)
MSNQSLHVSDGELIRRFNEGEETAFGTLVERYAGKAYQIAYGVLGNRQDAEEVSQDVFVRIHKALRNFRGDSEFSTWMYRITVNLARNKYRWNRSRGGDRNLSMDATVAGQDGSEMYRTLPAPERSPDAEAAANEFETEVMTQLETLPDLYREPLVLRNLDDMSYEQIALLLGCRLGTIKSRIARARDELRKRLRV